MTCLGGVLDESWILKLGDIFDGCSWHSAGYGICSALPALLPSWHSSTVVDLIDAFRKDNDCARFSIIADALQDAGCDNDVLLSHCYSSVPHTSDCWLRRVFTRARGTVYGFRVTSGVLTPAPGVGLLVEFPCYSPNPNPQHSLLFSRLIGPIVLAERFVKAFDAVRSLKCEDKLGNLVFTAEAILISCGMAVQAQDFTVMESLSLALWHVSG